jgi:hypothetical protein
MPWPSDLGTWQLVDAFPNASGIRHLAKMQNV